MMASGELSARRKSVETGIFFFLLVVLILFLFPYGKLNLTYDSYDYIKAGESLDTYLKGKNEDGYTYLYRAPLLPFFLSFFKEKVHAALWLNILSYAASLFLVFTIARKLGQSGLFLYGSVVITALSYQWLQNHFFLWTEPLFSTLILILVYSLLENKSVAVIVIICLLLFLLRKAGILFFLSAAVWNLRRGNFKNFSILIVVMLLVFIASELVILHYGGVSVFLSAVSLPADLNRIHYADVISSWVLPRSVSLLARALILGSVLIVLGIAFKMEVLAFVKNQNHQVMITVGMVYVLSIILFIGCLDYYEGERFLSVVVPLCTASLFSFCQYVAGVSPAKRTIIFVGISVWVLYPISRTLYHFLQGGVFMQ